MGSALSTGLAEEINGALSKLDEFNNAKTEAAESVTADGIQTEEDTPDTAKTQGNKRTNFLVDSLDKGSEAALNAIFSAQGGDKVADKTLSEAKKQTAELKKISAQPAFVLQVAGGVG